MDRSKAELQSDANRNLGMTAKASGTTKSDAGGLDEAGRRSVWGLWWRCEALYTHPPRRLRVPWLLH